MNDLKLKYDERSQSKLNDLKLKYDERSQSKLNDLILKIRSEYYKYIIIPIIKNFIEETSLNGKKILNGKIIERGCGMGHKMEKTIEYLLGDQYIFYGIEFSNGMKKIAETRFNNNNKVMIIEGLAEKLPFDDGVIDFVFDIQILHHHENYKKREMIKEAKRVLKKGGYIYILDTFLPSIPNFSYSIKEKIFSLLQSIYISKVGKTQYHNGTLDDIIMILNEEGFEINKKYSRGFKVFLGHVLGFDFINQIIASKK